MHAKVAKVVLSGDFAWIRINFPLIYTERLNYFKIFLKKEGF